MYAHKTSSHDGIPQAEHNKLSGREVTLSPDETIVSKTDTTGIITYANDSFIDISGFSERELIGVQHSIVRHPAMPRAIFKLAWDTLKKNREIFAYVVNRCKNGDHYWVFAHMTPCYGTDGSIIGFHSSRRAPNSNAVAAITPLYKKLCAIEQGQDSKQGLIASEKALMDHLASLKVTYGEFIFSL